MISTQIPKNPIKG